MTVTFAVRVSGGAQAGTHARPVQVCEPVVLAQYDLTGTTTARSLMDALMLHSGLALPFVRAMVGVAPKLADSVRATGGAVTLVPNTTGWYQDVMGQLHPPPPAVQPELDLSLRSRSPDYERDRRSHRRSRSSRDRLSVPERDASHDRFRHARTSRSRDRSPSYWRSSQLRSSGRQDRQAVGVLNKWHNRDPTDTRSDRWEPITASPAPDPAVTPSMVHFSRQIERRVGCRHGTPCAPVETAARPGVGAVRRAAVRALIASSSTERECGGRFVPLHNAKAVFADPDRLQQEVWKIAEQVIYR
ncbi:hypothetical protein AMAG_07106 [Allomyces macrogynus ATCC 38327]|uniref:Uncharacterized protein n=1 Tax=Allomyces macrogynus (strain ATCC 38327) TaxID=578462 RepID=A0A0L0SHA3_ALLM3|nr:hypothetical protein AMAG_07106 [Allomyces macrogynus ATCC 38327]|eukprot:KNE61829.1 hypothetical protein AMAG_07106 [Allomyces macrogynus ATCC 38327]